MPIFALLLLLAVHACDACISGWERVWAGSSYVCRQCKPGYFQPDTAQLSTDADTAEKLANALDKCLACPPGKFSRAAGMHLCDLCASGTYQPVKASSACLPFLAKQCASGQYFDVPTPASNHPP